MKTLLKSLPLFLLILTYSSCISGNETKTEAPGIKKMGEFSKARFKTAKGDIVIKFLDAKAPKTSDRIKELVKSGFYDGIKFHRVVPGFVIQAGDPQGTGSGGSGQKLKAEFNDEKHILGTVAMARLGHDINSADSQFYISLGTHPHLDKKYTVFAKVESGIDVAKKIAQDDKIISANLE